MSLAAGVRIGAYEVTAAIGAGGMGEVYRARDTVLKRDVALKVLPDSFTNDPDRLARFQREAEVLAALNHPHIAHIHGLEASDGVRALVLEFVDGPTLADRIAQGPLPLDEALPIARQIAEALEAAHEQGIIHRDLKPANIKLRPDGTVKVLDFGLAKAIDGSDRAVGVKEAGGAALNSPTITSPPMMTGVGALLGTAPYMSPEQARGKRVDKRADIWAFGCLLFEMLAGKRAFDGEDITETLAAVVKEQPDLTVLPFDVRRLVSKCLEKNPTQRLRDIGDAWELLQDASTPAPTHARSAARLAMMLALAAAAVLVAFGVGLWAPWRGSIPPPIVRFQLLPPEGTVFGNLLSVSPDGRTVAFTVREGDNQVSVWTRSLETLEARRLPGTEGAAYGLFWSPDSRFIGFGVGATLRKVDASGGPVQTLAALPFTFRGGAWSGDGVIIAGTNRSGLFRVSEAGGVAAPLTVLDPSRQETWHGNPVFLPDRRHFLYARRSASAEQSGTYVGSLDASAEQQDLRRLIAAGPAVVYAPSPDRAAGYLLFERGRALLAQPLDLRRLQPVGETIALGGEVDSSGALAYSASSTGVLAYNTGSAESLVSRLVWFDRQGNAIGQVGPPALYGAVYVAGDRKLFVSREEPGTDAGAFRVWTVDVPRNVFSRLNPGAADGSAVVSPDGRVAFSFITQGAVGDIYVRLADGVGQPELLVRSQTVKHPNDWSLDGRFLIYDEHHPTQNQDLWIVPMSEAVPGRGSERTPIPFLVTPADETFGQFSPDGKWVAYSSDESGTREVYVQGFAPDRVPAVGVGKWTISTAGGDKPRWRRDGREVFYIAPDGQMMAVPVNTSGGGFEPGVAVPLFQTNATGAFVPYAVTPDGRFLINTATEATRRHASPITVVLNWWAGLRK